MAIEWVRKLCLSLPHTTESVQWGDHLVFKVGGKIYLILALEAGGNVMSFKASPEEFADLIEMPGIVPAPYLARAHWVALEHERAVGSAELRKRVRRAYDLVFEKLPKKTKDSLKASK